MATQGNIYTYLQDFICGHASYFETKIISCISERHRRRLIREESELFASQTDENLRVDICVKYSFNNSILHNDDDEVSHIDYNNAVSNITHEAINLSPLSEAVISESDISLDNTSLFANRVSEDNAKEGNVNLETFKDFLTQWAVQHRIPHVALSDLLSGLSTRYEIFSDLPKCAKTLLHTPRSSDIKNMFPGQYLYVGIEHNIIQFLSTVKNIVPSSIKIQLGIDGMPISRSNSNQLWPILGRVMPNGKVFFIGCYFGKSKPANANEFLQAFVDDINILIANDITYNNVTFSISIHSIICDAPAKSFITFTKGHAGYFSCSKCIIEGEFIANRVCFPDLNCQNRTDVTFRNQDQEEHHLGRSVLLDIQNFDIISQIPLDYMHMICIGVMKKLINLWISGPLKTRCLSSQKIKNISKFLLNIRPYIPREFARRPRRLEDYSQWN